MPPRSPHPFIAAAAIDLSPSAEVRAQFLSLFCQSQRLPLTQYALAPKSAGVYGLYVVDDTNSDYLNYLHEQDLPVYLGKAGSSGIASRIRQHFESVDAANDVDVAWFGLAMVPVLNGSVSAVAGEETLFEAFGRPPWNGSGFGNKHLGNRRTAQKPSIWDCRYPGRGRGEALDCDSATKRRIEAGFTVAAQKMKHPATAQIAA